MTTYAYPTLSRRPNSITREFVANTDIRVSPFTGAVQSADRSGERLVLTLVYTALEAADANELTGFVMKLNGQQHRVDLPYHAIANQGTYGGTPLVDGANQTGNTLSVDGCSTSITDWQKRGDCFSVNDEMKFATDDADSNGAGEATLTFRPRLRSSPADDAAIETTDPTGVFLLMTPRSAFAEVPGRDGPLTDVTLQFMEDIT